MQGKCKHLQLGWYSQEITLPEIGSFTAFAFIAVDAHNEGFIAFTLIAVASSIGSFIAFAFIAVACIAFTLITVASSIGRKKAYKQCA